MDSLRLHPWISWKHRYSSFPRGFIRMPRRWFPPYLETIPLVKTLNPFSWWPLAVVAGGFWALASQQTETLQTKKHMHVANWQWRSTSRNRQTSSLCTFRSLFLISSSWAPRNRIPWSTAPWGPTLHGRDRSIDGNDIHLGQQGQLEDWRVDDAPGGALIAS